MISAPNFESSVEAYVKGFSRRHVFYGVTREDVIGPDPTFREHMFKHLCAVPADWEDRLVVAETKRVALGLGRQWTRASRRRDEYGELVT